MVAALTATPERLTRALQGAVLESTMWLTREVKERTPTATGTLRNSLVWSSPETVGGVVRGAVFSDRSRAGRAPPPGGVPLGVGSPLLYAAPVEFGTRPHHPPIQPLIDWVELKLGLRGREAESAARRIAWAIARRGTRGTGMFRAALARAQMPITRILVKHLFRGIGRLQQGGGRDG